MVAFPPSRLQLGYVVGGTFASAVAAYQIGSGLGSDQLCFCLIHRFNVIAMTRKPQDDSKW